MKKIIKVIIVGVLFVFAGFTAKAQAPYTHGIGVVVGMMDGVTYKTFAFGDRLAFQVDLAPKINVRKNWDFWSLDLNPNLMYQGKIASTGLYWFAGGGLSLGYVFSEYFDYGKFGVNAIAGLEYKFNIPLSLQFDFRPGYGLMFREHANDSYFDWSLNLSVRYTF
jgi:hypothetical protein